MENLMLIRMHRRGVQELREGGDTDGVSGGRVQITRCLPISVTDVPGGMAGGQRARCVEGPSGKISLSLPAMG